MDEIIQKSGPFSLETQISLREAIKSSFGEKALGYLFDDSLMTVDAVTGEIAPDIRHMDKIDLEKIGFPGVKLSSHYQDPKFLEVTLEYNSDNDKKKLDSVSKVLNDSFNSLSQEYGSQTSPTAREVHCHVLIDSHNYLMDLIGSIQSEYNNASAEKAGDSVIDKLIAQGIPEEAIVGNQELWDYIQKVERNEIVSANKNFYLTDSNGEKLLLKISDNKTKAEIEAAANYYLGNHFNFIVPGKSPQPIEANGLYLTLQKDVSEEVIVLKPLEYWVGSLALFHRDAERILRENNVEIKDKKLRSVEEIKEMYSRGRGVHDLSYFNESKLEDVINLLEEADKKDYIHGDLKNGNRYSSYLVDLEGCGKGHPGIDLSMLFMQYNLPQRDWEHYLNMYLEVRGVENSFDQELKELKEGVEKAAIYTSTKEVVGSSLREVRENTAKDNRLLTSYSN
jgi:hypothetical protein